VPSWTDSTHTTPPGYAPYPKRGSKITINGRWSFFIGLSSSLVSCATHSQWDETEVVFVECFSSVITGDLPSERCFALSVCPSQFLRRRMLPGARHRIPPWLVSQHKTEELRIMETKVPPFFGQIRCRMFLSLAISCRLWISTTEHPSDWRALDRG
jgi:hypothetical protein